MKPLTGWTVCESCGTTVNFPLLRCVDCIIASLAAPPLPSRPELEPHWACPDCGTPCRCQPDSLGRRFPHARCYVYAA